MSGQRNNILSRQRHNYSLCSFSDRSENCGEQTGWSSIYKRHKHINAEISLCKPEIFFASISENTDDLSWKYLKAHKTDTADRKRYLHGSLICVSDSHIIACSIIKTQIGWHPWARPIQIAINTILTFAITPTHASGISDPYTEREP